MRPLPKPKPGDPSFRLTVQDVFTIEGRGTVACGQVESGAVQVSDAVQLERPGVSRETAVLGIEMFQKTLTEAVVGDNVGIILSGIGTGDVKRGDLLTGTIPSQMR